MSVYVVYSGISQGAKESFQTIAPQDKLPQSDTSLINADGQTFFRYDTPMDLNSMILDGGARFLPDTGSAKIGFISEQLSGDDGTFETPISFEFSSDELFSSSGISFVFDEKKNIYANHINIKWYRGETIIQDSDFFPDNTNYFCSKNVEFYDKLVITFYSINVPKNRLRFNNIEHGIVDTFGADELESAKAIQEIDPISTSIPINTFDFSIASHENIEYSFEAKQPIYIYSDNVKNATAFVKNVKRTGKNKWKISAEDYIGFMDSTWYKGGIYNNELATNIISDIFSVAKVPYYLDSSLTGKYLTGYIPYSTCRESLMQVLFAVGAIADTSGSDLVKIYTLQEDISQTIQKNRILVGQSIDYESRVTAVKIFSHAYVKSQEEITVYDSKESGTGNGIFVVFGEPIHSLSIVNGTIESFGDNYAVINASDGCILNGKKYDHTKVSHIKNNPLVLSTDAENVVSINDATLVSSANVDEVLDKCYNYIVNSQTTNMTIIDAPGLARTTVGDKISFETEYLGSFTGRIVKQTFNLSGGIVMKESVVR